MIKVVIVEPRKEPYEKMIDGELESMQKIVGGYIEFVPFFGDLCIFCNEEGKLTGLPPNRPLNSDVILVGTFFVSKSDAEGESISLTDDDVAFVKKYYAGVRIL
jgi:hypothetical protein